MGSGWGATAFCRADQLTRRATTAGALELGVLIAGAARRLFADPSQPVALEDIFVVTEDRAELPHRGCDSISFFSVGNTEPIQRGPVVVARASGHAALSVVW